MSTDADGLLDILTPDHDALIVPRQRCRRPRREDRLGDRSSRSARALFGGRPAVRTALRHLAFVRKMERLYTLLHEVSARCSRRAVASGRSVVSLRVSGG